MTPPASQASEPTPDGAARTHPLSVCVPITAFPVAGGMRSVLSEVARVMENEWRMEYLTRHPGPDVGTCAIHAFGRGHATPWQFPNVWLYVWAGWRALQARLRRGAGYQVILPQDGVYTGAFAVLAAKLAGIPVIVMDHGTVTLPFSPRFRAERLHGFANRAWLTRTLARARLAAYVWSLRRLVGLTARAADHVLIAGEEVETVYHRLGVARARITRYPYIVDAERFKPYDAQDRAALRAEYGWGADTLLVTLISRLAPEKGIEIALEGLALAIATLPPAQRGHVRLLIAGDGPLRKEVESSLDHWGLSDRTVMWGEATPDQVISLLGMSDIFLYTGVRGTNYSMAVLEAMAAGCAVVASVEPQSNGILLADGRGLAVPGGDTVAVGAALARLLADAGLRHEMGRQARTYVKLHHSDVALRQALRQALQLAQRGAPQVGRASGTRQSARQRTRENHA